MPEAYVESMEVVINFLNYGFYITYSDGSIMFMPKVTIWSN